MTYLDVSLKSSVLKDSSDLCSLTRIAQGNSTGSHARDRERTLSHYPAFTFFNTLIYYIYALDGTVLSRQEARRENAVARTPCVLKLVSIQQIGASMKPLLRSSLLSTVIHKPESGISSPCLKPGDSTSPDS